jgi:thymidine phosphorylase
MATRSIGLQVIALGGGRHRAPDAIDPRVGFTQFVQTGQRVEKGTVIAVVHAADIAAAEAARFALLDLIEISESPPTLLPVLRATVY